MNPNLKVYMLFKDRVGIVADISCLIAQRRLNIISMEVERADDKATVHLELDNGTTPSGHAEIFETLWKVPGILEVKFVETLPQETRENRFRVVLDNIRDGVISIDNSGKITTINRIARRLLNCRGDDIIGKDIKDLPFSDYRILECLKGKKYTNIKNDIINDRGRFQYFATSRPVMDSAGRIIGAVEIRKDMREIKMLARSISQPDTATFSDFVGKSPIIQDAIQFAQKIAVTDSVISIRGDSGTGKELFARAIHDASGRKGPFVPINCAALPEPLLESELFGYVAGAFTGAGKEGKAGLFELAGSGTILLDEIGDMPLGVQAKILRVIQEKTVRRIGGLKESPINCRIFTATNKNLEEMVREKVFREDLYYRVNVLPILIPPLRERTEDISLLVEHFLFQLDSKLDKSPQALTSRALNKLRGHGWPGNVRELKNVIERAAILCDSDEIDIDCVLFGSEIMKGGHELKKCAPIDGLEGASLHEILDSHEKHIVAEALEKSKSIRKAAKFLGLSHTALLNKMKKYEILVTK